MMNLNTRAAILAAAAGLTLAFVTLDASAQAITPPNVSPQAGQWAFSPPYAQQLTGSFNVTTFRLVATGGACGGGAYHPGSVPWDDPSLAGVGALPPDDGDPGPIDAIFTFNFGPVEGVWEVNFRNHWSSGDIPWSDIQIIPCAPGTCPESGACCLPNGTCQVLLDTVCVAQGGTFQGAAVPCGACPTPPGVFAEVEDAGELPALATVVSQVTGSADPLISILGKQNFASDVDLYLINICDPFNFSAETLGGAEWDTMLWLFDEAGNGIVANDDSGGTLQSRITGELVPGAGHYFIGITRYARRPVADPYGAIWTSYQNIAPNGPGAMYPVTSWGNTTSMPGNPQYAITFTGTCFVQTTPPCYVNCDVSTVPPILNVEDFTCFINEFAAGQVLPHEQQLVHYANCDQSTTAPVLNVEDFTCFINKFAQGCD
jgi:hypothetical protein